MKRNFSFVSMVEIRCEGTEYDLHNDFDCAEVSIKPIEGSLILVWEARADRSQKIEIRFESIQYLRLQGVDQDMPRAEDCRLSFAGYLHPDQGDVMDGFVEDNGSMEGYHMIFCFEGGLVAKVLSRTVECRALGPSMQS